MKWYSKLKCYLANAQVILASEKNISAITKVILATNKLVSANLKVI